MLKLTCRGYWAIGLVGLLFFVGCGRFPSDNGQPTVVMIPELKSEGMMTMVVNVQLTPGATQLWYAQPETAPELADLRHSLAELGVSLKPQFPDVDDETLRPFFIIEVDDQAQAEQVIARLRSLEVVDGIYLKPAEGLP